MTVVEYDPALVKQISSTLGLRLPNERALDALAAALGGAEDGAELVADLATGVGKTYIAGALLDYLYEQGVRNVVIITPGSTIQRKTIANLTPGNPKYLRGIQCRPTVITLDDVETGTVGAALDNPDTFKVFVLTVQSLLRPDTKDNRRAHRPHEMLGQALSDYLRTADDLVVIADEHHVYFSGNAKRFRAAINDLHPAALIGLTATPHESTVPDRIVFHYPLADAIADGYVKIPVLVARPDGAKDLRTQMADGVALLDAKAHAMKAYCDRTGDAYITPVMFVVAQTIDEANRIRDMLAGADMLGRDDQVLVVTSEEPDETLRLLDQIEDPASNVRAVVSVSMLKEGWDVKNIYVIAAVRALESQLLTEQVLGRGLRLPFGKRTGVGMLDTVEVISHHAFRDLLQQAKVLLQQTLQNRADEAHAVAVTTPGVNGAHTTPDGLAGAAGGSERVVITLPGAAQADREDELDAAAGQDGLPFDADEPVTEHQVAGISTVADRLADGDATSETLTTVYVPRQLTGVTLPLFLPRVTTRWVRDPFSLAQIDLIDVEDLGRQFADDNAPTLTRKAIEAHRTDTGVEIEIVDRSSDDEAVTASQTRLPFDTIETDLVQRLMSSNAVAATTSEMNAATAIARAFLRGANVSASTPWRAEHGRLATTALVQRIQAKQTSSPAKEVAEVTRVRWPDPEEQMYGTPPTSRNLITSSVDFVRSQPYSGWTRGVYDTCAFDAYSTEFRLAELFDRTPTGVRTWARITHTVPLTIGYTIGAITRLYMPDFIVIDDQNTYWVVEGKREDEMTSEVVLAKERAAKAWVNAVNNGDDVHQRWGYLLASESVIKNAANWAALLAAGRTHR